jgi:bacterioferritin-associated ferredoxin
MIVCSCNVLSDTQVRTVVSENTPRATSQVYGCLGCSAQCGRCARTIRKIMDQVLGGCPVGCGCCLHAQQNQDHSAHTIHPHPVPAVMAAAT